MFFVYILECNDKTLYTGYTNDLENRLRKHNEGTGARYTRARLPVTLEYHESMETKSDALRREIEIKGIGRAKKLKMIEDWKIKQSSI